MQELKLKSFHCDNLPHAVCMPHYCIMCLKCNVSLFFPSWSQNTIYTHLCRNWLKTPWMECVTTSPGLFYTVCKQPVWCGLMIGGWAQLNSGFEKRDEILLAAPNEAFRYCEASVTVPCKWDSYQTHLCPDLLYFLVTVCNKPANSRLQSGAHVSRRIAEKLHRNKVGKPEISCGFCGWNI